MKPPSNAAEKVLQQRLSEGPDRPTRQMNLTFTEHEVEMVEAIAERLGWSKRRVIACGVELLDATLEEMAYVEPVSA